MQGQQQLKHLLHFLQRLVHLCRNNTKVTAISSGTVALHRLLVLSKICWAPNPVWHSCDSAPDKSCRSADSCLPVKFSGVAGETSLGPETDAQALGHADLEIRSNPRQERPALRQEIGVPLEAVSDQTVGQIQKQMQGTSFSVA